MSGSGRAFAPGLRLALVSAGTTWLAMLAWRGFAVEWGRYLGPLFLVALVVAGVGTAARWARVSGWLVFLLQLVAVALVSWLVLGGSPTEPVASTHRLIEHLGDAVTSANTYAPPVPTNVPPITSLLVLCGAAALLVVDLLACTLRRVPLAGLPLLAVYCVPVSLLDHGVAWLVFLLTAAGFMLMLYLQESEHIARWGRPVGTGAGGDDGGFGLSTGASRGSASSVGALAMVLAVVVPIFIPTFDLATWGFGPGDGNGPIKIVNPMADLRRDLVQGSDRPLVRFTTDDPSPSYLRISVLTRYNGVEWSAGNRQVPDTQQADGLVPLEQGLDSSVQTRSFTYSFQATSDFQSRWLPTQFPAAEVRAAGDWRYDTSTMDFLAGNDSTETTGLRWSVVGVKPKLSGYAMSRSLTAPAGVQVPYTALPDTVPPLAKQLAAQVTAQEDSRFEKAVALQRWFRETGGFRYSLKTSPGNGNNDLENFLTDGPGGRVGYCEQFASAFAIMARSLQIPARVAVGFLDPEQVGKDTYEYSSHDLHAWPELYFQGSGWVRFEPTPGRRASAVPAYTVGRVSRPDNPDSSAPTSRRAVPTDETSSADPRDTRPDEARNGAGSGGVHVPWLVLLGVLLAVVVVALLVVLPRVLRSRRREARLSGGAEAVWAELRDSVTDLGLAWPEGRSPREAAHQLAHWFGARPDGTARRIRPERGGTLAPDAVDSLDRIVLALELLRYARQPQDAEGTLRADAERCIQAWDDGATTGARRRALWLPRSLFVRRPAQDPAVDEQLPELVGTGGVVDHVS